jgi:flagellar biosynthesis chaperone FliJ
MKFNFPLQILLNWKRNLEEFAQMKLAEKIQRLRKQEEEIERLAFLRLSRDEELQEKSTLTKERKILDRLKEKGFRTFLRQMDIRDQKEIDEMTTLKYRRFNKD